MDNEPGKGQPNRKHLKLSENVETNEWFETQMHSNKEILRKMEKWLFDVKNQYKDYDNHDGDNNECCDNKMMMLDQMTAFPLLLVKHVCQLVVTVVGLRKHA